MNLRSPGSEDDPCLVQTPVSITAPGRKVILIFLCMELCDEPAKVHLITVINKWF